MLEGKGKKATYQQHGHKPAQQYGDGRYRIALILVLDRLIVAVEATFYHLRQQAQFGQYQKAGDYNTAEEKRARERNVMISLIIIGGFSVLVVMCAHDDCVIKSFGKQGASGVHDLIL